jgi:hypothetical protein
VAVSGRSVNGWPLLAGGTTGPLPRLRKWTVPGTGRHLYLRDGSAGFVLVHLALWFHERVERLDLGVWDEWGWAPRPIRGGTAPSNHGSGTAADLNATRHPFGVATARTFTPGQIRRIRRRLKLYRGLIDWGGNWSHADAMHFELAPGSKLAAVERLARLLTKTPRGKRVLAANPGALAVIKS